MLRYFRWVSVETINDITTHTTTAGRQGYSRLEAVEALQAHRAADNAKSQPIEKMQMSSAGSITVGIDGTQLPPQSAGDESVTSSVLTSTVIYDCIAFSRCPHRCASISQHIQRLQQEKSIATAVPAVAAVGQKPQKKLLEFFSLRTK